MSAAPANPSSQWYEQWPQLGSDADFAELRALLEDTGYTEKAILERTGRKDLEDYCKPPETGRPIQDLLEALIGLFYDCAFIEESRLSADLPAAAVALLDRMGLLVRKHAPEGMLYSSAAILPCQGLPIVCDRGTAPDGRRILYPSDVVYPPITEGSRRFVSELPSTPCDAFLEMGTGSGIAALLGARSARQVWATDVTDRAVRFAEFNRRLNGMENMTVQKGDLYAPVQGLTFDRIGMHPPYVPANVRHSDHVFAVGGEDGEQVLRAAIQGIPTFLRPGGRFYSLQVATDREGEDFEERVRKWLGDTHEEYDVMVASHSRLTPLEYLVLEERRIVEESRGWLALWERTHTKYMLYTTLLIERHDQPRRTVTRRGQRGEGYVGGDLAQTLEWIKAADRPDHVEMLLECRPLARPENELTVKLRLRDGKFRTEEYRLEIPGPFALSLRCEHWLTQLIPYCDGVKTWREHYEFAKRENIIREDVPIEEFAKGLGVLVALGAFKLPQ